MLKSQVCDSFEVYCYCLMDNHIHLIVKSGQLNTNIGTANQINCVCDFLPKFDARVNLFHHIPQNGWIGVGAGLNGGILMKPYAVDRVENDEGRIVKAFEPSAYGSLMTGEEAGILKGLMESVVEEGTGRKLSGLSYTAAGKTGSAEYNDVKEDSHAWFTGFAPVENPEICVTIIVEGAGSGGDYAVPIARRIFDAYFNDGR